MKLKIALHDQQQYMVKGSGLFLLTTCSYLTIDNGLMHAFVERLHKDEHLSFAHRRANNNTR